MRDERVGIWANMGKSSKRSICLESNANSRCGREAKASRRRRVGSRPTLPSQCLHSDTAESGKKRATYPRCVPRNIRPLGHSRMRSLSKRPSSTWPLSPSRSLPEGLDLWSGPRPRGQPNLDGRPRLALTGIERGWQARMADTRHGPQPPSPARLAPSMPGLRCWICEVRLFANQAKQPSLVHLPCGEEEQGLGYEALASGRIALSPSRESPRSTHLFLDPSNLFCHCLRI